MPKGSSFRRTLRGRKQHITQNFGPTKKHQDDSQTFFASSLIPQNPTLIQSRIFNYPNRQRGKIVIVIASHPISTNIVLLSSPFPRWFCLRNRALSHSSPHNSLSHHQWVDQILTHCTQSRSPMKFTKLSWFTRSGQLTPRHPESTQPSIQADILLNVAIF